MTEVQQASKVETVKAIDLIEKFHSVPAFAGITADDFRSFGEVQLIHSEKDADLFEVAGVRLGFWVIFAGQIRLFRREDDGSLTPFSTMAAGDTFGEAPLLMGKEMKGVGTVLEPVTIAYLNQDTFWRLMSCCQGFRAAVLENMAHRLQLYQSQALHREKLISLGTLAAGLMHELNNPGAAAKRAASQLRENLRRLQLISLRICSGERKTEGQMECLRNLQMKAFDPHPAKAMGSLEQSDAEEHLTEWLEEHGIENAWKLAPTLTAIGLDPLGLNCAHEEFPGPSLSDPLNWMEALVSSAQLVVTIEESISRVTDLVKAVKKYGYEDKSERHEVDIHDSIQSTLVILGHKFREKELTVLKNFAADLGPISTCGKGLNQVWTNLLDNAIDAAPAKSTITVRTWIDGPQVCVGIADNGAGIAAERKSHIFEPFYTTKPVGEGTGLGLDIVHRIVVGQFGGNIQVDSEPGHTEFIVRLPLIASRVPACPLPVPEPKAL